MFKRVLNKNQNSHVDSSAILFGRTNGYLIPRLNVDESL